MTQNEFDKKLSDNGWKWSCWENTWRKDGMCITSTDTDDVVILTETVNGETIETEKTFKEICIIFNI